MSEKELKKVYETEVEVITEEEYLGSKGYGFMGYSEAGLHNSSQHDSKRGRKSMVERARQKAIEYDLKREELRKEYQEKVANGEIRKPTAMQERIKTAQGMDGREDAEAARRILTKLGIDWKTGNSLQEIEKSNVENNIESGMFKE